MQQQMTPPIPGNRIADYRNSKPRFVRLYGLGDRGASLARAIAREAGPNVAIKSGSQPVGWHEIAGDMPDPKTNMVVIVCGEGDQALFARQGRTIGGDISARCAAVGQRSSLLCKTGILLSILAAA